MPEYLHGEGLSERQRLEAFPAFLRNMVNQALESRFLDPEMVDYLRRAWAEIIAAGELERLMNAL